MKDVWDNLGCYGLDIEATRARFMGNEDLYNRCLKKFFAQNEFELLKATIKEEDYTAAFEYAHALKGVAGNLGLLPFYQAICDLVEALRGKKYEDVAGLCERSEDQFTQLKHIVATVFIA